MSTDVQLDERQLEVQWQGIVSRRLRYRRRRQQVRAVTIAAGLMTVATALVLALSPDARRDTPAGAFVPELQADGRSHAPVRLPGGAPHGELQGRPEPSQLFDVAGVDVEPSPGAELRVCTPSVVAGHCWRVLSGRAVFDVTPGRSTPVLVRAGAAEVRVLGTQFSVYQGAHTEVSVARGQVEVRSGEVRKLLKTGEAWTSAGAERKGASTRRTRGRSSLTAVATSADRAWQRAEQARRQRPAAEQVSSFRRFLERYPADPRASLAALQLARIHMDQLRDDGRALPWLRRASQRGLAPALQEDALARLVTIYDRSDRPRLCRRSQRRYLERFPNGVQSLKVRKACAK